MGWMILICIIGFTVTTCRYYYLEKKEKSTVITEIAGWIWLTAMLMWVLVNIIIA